MTEVYVCEEGWHTLNLEEGKKKNKTVLRWLEVMPKHGLYSLDNGMSLKNIR